MICVEKLTQKNINTQSKLRLKSQREKSIRKKNCNIKRVQNKCVLVSNEDNNVVLRKNIKVIGACKFCGDKSTPHRITSCPVRKSFQLLGREYEISTQDNYMDLRTRIENAMPLAKRPKESTINEIPNDVQRCNFIIHEAYSNYE